MRDITKLKRNIENILCKKYCNIDSIDLCKDTSKCSCSIAAEIRAYLQSIIPSPYFKYSIKDFRGYNDLGEKIISNECLKDAKQKLIEYCWNKDVNISNIDSFSSDELDEMSIVDSRRKQGKNVVIYSSNRETSGRTFVSSLIMKEVIKRRSFPNHFTDKYSWIQYSLLKDSLIRDYKEDTDLAVSKYADWLVVDDIILSSTDKQKTYISSVIDPFFTQRNNDGLPTIFVFKFDIKGKNKKIEEEFGSTLGRIADERNGQTHFISLC